MVVSFARIIESELKQIIALFDKKKLDRPSCAWWSWWYCCALSCYKLHNPIKGATSESHMPTLKKLLGEFKPDSMGSIQPPVNAEAIAKLGEMLDATLAGGDVMPLYAACIQTLRHSPARKTPQPWLQMQLFRYVWVVTESMPPSERKRVLDLVMDTAMRIMLSSPDIANGHMPNRLIATACRVLTTKPASIHRLASDVEDEEEDEGQQPQPPPSRGAEASGYATFEAFIARSKKRSVTPCYPVGKRARYHFEGVSNDDLVCAVCKERPPITYCENCYVLFK